MDTRTTAVWITAIAALLTLLLSPVACTMHRNRMIAEIVKNGADPIEAKCALTATPSNSDTGRVCFTKALRAEPQTNRNP